MPEQLRNIIITIIIFLYSGALVQNGLLPIPISWFNIAAVAVTGLLVMSRFKQVMQFTSHSKSLIFLIILAMASTLWSINPEITLNRTIILGGASALGIYIASQFTFTEQIAFYIRVLVLAMLASYVAAIVFPQAGIHQEPFHLGRWRGIAIHKNVLGEWMSLCTVMLVLLPHEFLKIPKYLKYALVIPTIILLGLTVSLTSIFSVAIITLLFPIIVILRWDYRLKAAIILYTLALILVTAVFISLNFADLLAQIGRTPTLSGRSTIWPIIVTVISERPLLGYGYMSFFVPEVYLVDTVFTDVWRPEHAHNVWLDMTMDFGLIGLMSLVYVIMRGFQQCYKLYVRHYHTEVLLVILMLLNVLTSSITETFAIRRRDVIWIMFVSLLVRLHHEYRKVQDVNRS